MTKDPVCGMLIDEAKAVVKADYQGTTYHFCSAKCEQTFKRDPGKYAKPPTAPKPD